MSRTEELRKKLRDRFLEQAGPYSGDEVWEAFNSAVDRDRENPDPADDSDEITP